MRRGRLALAIFAGVVALVAAACRKPSETFCGGAPDVGCVCRTYEFRLLAGEKRVDTCTASAARPRSQCCHDRDASGETSTCSCASPLCVTPGDGTCSCRMIAHLGESDVPVNLCKAASASLGTMCCKKADVCECGRGACVGGTPVERCTADDVAATCPSAWPVETRSCAGLTWKKKKAS